MKRIGFIKQGLFALVFFQVITLSHAGAPLWTFTPLTETTISVPANSTATVQYQVTNQSSRAHTLAMSSITGVSQLTTGVGVCGNPFTLSGHGSCTLSLQIDGSQVASGSTNGPIVCEQGSTLQCYRPSPADILNITVTASQYSLGGSISGLTGTVYLQNNGVSPQPFSSNGSFTLATGLTTGTTYNVTVQSQPVDQICSVANGVGTINGANVTNVTVTCATDAFTVGGTVSGLSGTVILLNNGGDADTITSNGSFTFATPVAEGSPYNVTVGTQPSGQTCTVTNGSGTMGGSDVTNVSVSCATNTPTLSTSLSNLALETSGNARTITITNTGSYPAENLSINYPSWPSGTSANSNCGSSLGAMDTCTITVNPGASAKSSCNSPYSAPTPGVITVSASNVASSVTTNVYVLTYGCIYQEGYIFAIDDTTLTSTSIGGTTAALANNSLGIPWYNGTYVTTNAQSLTDGATNTANIISVQGAGSYAAETCATYTVDSSGNSPCLTGTCYSNWYLPAICQMGASGEGAGCSSGTANMVSNLPNLISGCSGPSCLSGDYWSSTEFSSPPPNNAWYEGFSSGGSLQFLDFKGSAYAVRCSRALTP